jgi:hypothetical protein
MTNTNSAFSMGDFDTTIGQSDGFMFAPGSGTALMVRILPANPLADENIFTLNKSLLDGPDVLG